MNNDSYQYDAFAADSAQYAGAGQVISWPDIVDGRLELYPNFFTAVQSQAYFRQLVTGVNWRQETIHLYGASHPVPRLSAFYGDAGGRYAYSGIAANALPFSHEMLQIKQSVEQLSGHTFNCALINYYRDGSDGVAWHSDDEVELGSAPTIASVSFGETRKFQLRHKTRRDQKHSLELADGSLLLMHAPTQRYWQHQVPKTRRAVGQRINLTFRKLC